VKRFNFLISSICTIASQKSLEFLTPPTYN
jgi:hypothetical protein